MDDFGEDLQILRYIYRDAVKKIGPQAYAQAALHAFAQSPSSVTKRAAYMSIRDLTLTAGYSVTLSHWQSPSYDSSTYDEAGTRRGRITANVNDYTRDQHELANRYGQHFIASYIRHLPTVRVHAYATSSGMAAYTTALMAIIGSSAHLGLPILAGKQSYFQNKAILTALCGKRLVWIDESRTDAVIAQIQALHPAAVCIDTIGNTPSIHVADVISIWNYIRKSIKNDIWFLVDHTCAGPTVQFLKDMIVPPSFARLLVVESLNKHHQFGLDRVTGGIVWGVGKGVDQLYYYRNHGGTIISDVSAAALPTPNRRIFDLYHKRLIRNTALLVELLRRYLPSSYILSYPPEGVDTAVLPAFCTITARKSTAADWRRRIRMIIARARKQHIPLVAGSSFGLWTTRIYTVAANTQYEYPFFRIAPGMETAEEIRAIARIIDFK